MSVFARMALNDIYHTTIGLQVQKNISYNFENIIQNQFQISFKNHSISNQKSYQFSYIFNILNPTGSSHSQQVFVTFAGAPVDAAVVAQLRGAAAAGKQTRCVYEAGNSACQERSPKTLETTKRSFYKGP